MSQIAIRSAYKLLLSAQPDGSVRADKDYEEPGPWETYVPVVIKLDEGGLPVIVAFASHHASPDNPALRRYLKAVGGTGPEVVLSDYYDSPGPHEMFHLTRLDDAGVM